MDARRVPILTLMLILCYPLLFLLFIIDELLKLLVWRVDVGSGSASSTTRPELSRRSSVNTGRLLVTNPNDDSCGVVCAEVRIFRTTTELCDYRSSSARKFLPLFERIRQTCGLSAAELRRPRSAVDGEVLPNDVGRFI